MTVRLNQNVGMLLLALWLILSGLSGLVAFPMPAMVLPLLALIAGVLILVRR
jgi:hypothetical protein